MIDQRLDLILVGSHMLLKGVLYLLDLTHLFLSIFALEVVNTLNLASCCLLVLKGQSLFGVMSLTLAVDFLLVIFEKPSFDLLLLVFQMRRFLHKQGRLHIPHDESWVVILKVFLLYNLFFEKVLMGVHLPGLLDKVFPDVKRLWKS